MRRTARVVALALVLGGCAVPSWMPLLWRKGPPAPPTVAGNPLRFRHGTMPIRPDEEWRRKMARGDRLLVSAVTWPLELAYRASRDDRLSYR